MRFDLPLHGCFVRVQDTQVVQWLPGSPLCSSEAASTPGEPDFTPADSSSGLTWTACPDGFYSLSPDNELVFPLLAPGQAVQIPVRTLLHVPSLSQ